MGKVKKHILINCKDFTIASRTYASKEEVYYEGKYPSDIIWKTIIYLSIVNVTNINHIAQYDINMYGGGGFTIKNNFAGSLTDAITIRIFYIVIP